MYDSIKRKPLESGIDEVNDSLENSLETDVTDRIYHVLIPGTFVEVELPESAPLFKEGFLLRKNIMDGPHKKVARGKRQWKTYYAYLKGFLLYFVPPNGQLHYADTSNAIVITHCLAMTAADYQKKNTVLRVTTSDWHAFLLQANNFNDLQQWIYSINRAAATYSAPPLAAPIASGRGFQRPTFPLAPTKNTLVSNWYLL
jgi:PH/SEC7 domain-containing protein